MMSAPGAITGQDAIMPPMRRAPALVSLAVAVSLVALGGALAAAHGVKVASKAASLAPSGFVVQPEIADPLCNGGRGARLPGRLGGDAVVASATIADGSTLIALTNIYPGRRSAVLRSVTPACALNREFGDDGAATITIPSSPRPADPAEGGFPAEGIWINAIAARRGGGAIVAGVYGGDWVVGEVTARGTVDQTFGSHGWVLLGLAGEVTAVLQEPSGRIIIAGDNGGGGCCTVNWAAALSEHGQLENGFGTQGRAMLPTGEDSGVHSLALEPNGDILAEIGYGNMGCWGLALAMLTPSGAPEPMFGERLQQFWDAHRFGAFVGDVHIDREGFTLVGTGQKPCYDEPPGSIARATGLIAHFRVDGTPAGPTVRFPSQMYGSLRVLTDRHDTIFATTPYADSAEITLTALQPDGATDPRFASHDNAHIRTPGHGSSSASSTVEIDEASPTGIVIIAIEPERNQMQLIRLRF
jgi:hypothetical protein